MKLKLNNRRKFSIFNIVAMIVVPTYYCGFELLKSVYRGDFNDLIKFSMNVIGNQKGEVTAKTAEDLSFSKLAFSLKRPLKYFITSILIFEFSGIIRGREINLFYKANLVLGILVIGTYLISYLSDKLNVLNKCLKYFKAFEISIKEDCQEKTKESI